MRQPSLDEEYRMLVQEGLARGELSIRTDGPDHRSEPRFRIGNAGIAVRVEPQFKLVDISAVGIAFLSELPFHSDELLHVVLRRTLTFQARVVRSLLVETDPNLLEARYRVQCRFNNPGDGKQLLVLMKEMERLNESSQIN
jgi:hypothetical protein